MEKSDVKIDTVFTVDNVKIIVKKAVKGCVGCHFYNACTLPPKLKVMPCFGNERTDGEPVFYPECK